MIEYKSLSRLRFLTAAVIFLFLSVFTCGASAPGESDYSDAELTNITLRTLKTLHKNHYRQLELTPKVALAHFETYIKDLDGNKFFFTEQDIKLFKRPPEELFAALLKGDNSKAFQIYSRFLSRHREYRQYAESFSKAS